MNKELKEALQDLKDKGGEAIRIVKGFDGVPIGADFYGEYVHKPAPLQCSTHVTHTGEYCPEKPKHTVDGYLLCAKCYKAAKAMEAPKMVKRFKEVAFPKTISDGHGSEWDADCPSCGAKMQVMRPGYARCSEECWFSE